MKRRDFLRNSLLASTTISLAGYPINLLGKESELTALAEQSTNDRVLIILQMHGGNDGLNSVIPIAEYDEYYSRRANIAIPRKDNNRSLIELDNNLPLASQVGLHPDMGAMKELYDMGRVGIIQGVSYKNNNGSHFRGRDIWHMGGGYDDYYSSGWVGRYLQQAYQPKNYPDDFPNPEMKDPLAIELGSDVSLIFHQEGNIPASISLGSNPESFANLIDELEGFEDEGLDPRGKPPEAIKNSPYGKELDWILGLEDKTEDYAQRLSEVWQASSESTATYPETYPFNAPNGSKKNPLSGQLQLISRLLDGGGAGQGVKTKVFLLRIGGFDTHAEQVESFDPTMGVHAAKMYHISAAIKAFQQDLRNRGLEDRVLTITTSEFGRRIASNGSYGTDHGTGAPMFIFGNYVNPGVIGTPPDLSMNNVEMQYDFRQVYAAILKDWFEVDDATVQDDILYGNYSDGPDEVGGLYEPLPIIGQNIIAATNDFISKGFYIEPCYPNPAKGKVEFNYYVNSFTPVRIYITDINGRKRKLVENRSKMFGHHTVQADVSDLTAGAYIYHFEAGPVKTSNKLMVIK
jgi:uncharacterized protein (DUF1501 family)